MNPVHIFSFFFFSNIPDPLSKALIPLGFNLGSCQGPRMNCLNSLPVYSSGVCFVVPRRENLLHESTDGKMGIDLKRLLHMYDYEINAEMSSNAVRVDWFPCNYSL